AYGGIKRTATFPVNLPGQCQHVQQGCRDRYCLANLGAVELIELRVRFVSAHSLIYIAEDIKNTLPQIARQVVITRYHFDVIDRAHDLPRESTGSGLRRSVFSTTSQRGCQPQDEYTQQASADPAAAQCTA